MLLVKGIYTPKRVLVGDRVKTKSGRCGRVISTSGSDTATVLWDDGDSFPIRFGHLEILAHNQEKGLQV